MPQYVKRAQAAQHFQVSERTIRNWIGEGHIRGFRFSANDIRVNIDEIESMLANTPVTKARDGRKLYGPASRIVDMSNVVLPESGQ